MYQKTIFMQKMVETECKEQNKDEQVEGQAEERKNKERIKKE